VLAKTLSIMTKPPCVLGAFIIVLRHRRGFEKESLGGLRVLGTCGRKNDRFAFTRKVMLS